MGKGWEQAAWMVEGSVLAVKLVQVGLIKKGLQVASTTVKELPWGGQGQDIRSKNE